jgi:hypothetical protein
VRACHFAAGARGVSRRGSRPELGFAFRLRHKAPSGISPLYLRVDVPRLLLVPRSGASPPPPIGALLGLSAGRESRSFNQRQMECAVR